MGRREKEAMAFIDSIPDSKLTGLPQNTSTTIFKDKNFRLDMQGVCRCMALLSLVLTTVCKQMTSSSPKQHNLQVQVNYQTTITSLQEFSPDSCAKVLAPMVPNEA